MAVFDYNTPYYLCPHGQSNVYMNRYGNGNPANNQNVSLYAPLGSDDQRWKFVDAGSNNIRVLSELNNAFGLNVWLGAANKYNCDICTVAGNAKDSLIKPYAIVPSGISGTGVVCIKFQLVHYPDYYLTAVGSDVRWQTDHGTQSPDQLWWFSTSQGGGGTTSGILSKDTMPPTATASTPYIINGIPDKQQSDGIDDGVEYHPGCGFANGLNFNTSSDGAAVKTALRAFARKVFNINYDMADKDLCFYMYGERIANGAGQQFHPGVDISYGLNKPIYALFGGTVVYSGGNSGTVSIQVPTQNNVIMNYLHMQNIQKSKDNTVVAGEIIGYQGYKGLSSSNATHLHFEVRQNGSPNPQFGPTSPSTPMNTIKPYGYMQG